MAIRYRTLDEAAVILSAGQPHALTRTDVLELARRGAIRLAMWYDGSLEWFEDDPFEPEVHTGLGCRFTGYLAIPPNAIKLNTTVISFMKAQIIETAKIAGQSDEPNGDMVFLGRLAFAPETGRGYAEAFHVSIDDAVVVMDDLPVQVDETSEGSARATDAAQQVLVAALSKHADIDLTARGAPSKLEKVTEFAGEHVSAKRVRRVLAKMPRSLKDLTRKK